MSKAIVLDSQFKKDSEIEIGDKLKGINQHNLYLYVKSYLSSFRANNAMTKNRSAVSGGGKKPKKQKGSGGARWGSKRSPLFVGGGTIFGPTKKNYDLKVNRKQKKLALLYALNEQAKLDSLFVTDSIKIESGKTKDAQELINNIKARDCLIVVENLDEKTYLAFRNIKSCYMIEKEELNAYLLATYHAVIIEKAVFESLV